MTLPRTLRLAVLTLCGLGSFATADEPVSFRRDVMPIFFRAGCNAGTCHGSARGKDGFMLSLFGYDTKGDYFRLTEELVGRRINVARPEESLLLTKAAGQVPHTGGKRFGADSPYYATLRTWIEQGAPDDSGQVPDAVAITLAPDKLLFDVGGKPIVTKVTARYSDGSTRDVTSLALFFSNNPDTAAIDRDGLVTPGQRGDTFVLARFNRFTVGSEVIVLPKESEYRWTNPPASNFIDELVYDRLQKLHLLPSELCDDETFLRRVYLDLAGTTPTVAQYREFLNDSNPKKREALVDRLLAGEEFTQVWTALWAEWVRIMGGGYAPTGTDVKAAEAYYQWIHDQFAANRPFNEFVADQITASGSNINNGPANLYTMLVHDVRFTPKEFAANFSQLMTGIQIQCAECHNHPFDRWTQDDYYNFSAFFSQVGRKAGEDQREQIIFNAGGGEVPHPVTGQNAVPHFLGGGKAEIKPGEDRRMILAKWLASPQNPYFAKNFANRVWQHFFGLGIVEEIDDVRISNPESNPELLEAMAKKLTESNYDFKGLVRDICNSKTYQRSTQRNESNLTDERNFAHQSIRRIKAESMLDIISQVTNTKDKFRGLPRGARAVQIADGATSDYFLTTFGRATRETACSCEVKMEPTLSQALHLMNGDLVNAKMQQGGVIKSVIDQKLTPEQTIEQLYITCLVRKPTDAEMNALKPLLAEGTDKNKGVEDIFWALMNSREFLFNH